MKNLNYLKKCKNYVGMRTIKTALAVTISVIVAEIFNLQSPFFVANGALMTMENSVKKGFKTGISAVLGTIIGCCMAIIAVLIDPGNILLLFFGIIILITVLNTLKWQDSISMACVVFCVIMITMEDKNIVLYAVQRTADTIVGIVISLIINYIISPPENAKITKSRINNEEVEESIEEKSEITEGTDNVMEDGRIYESKDSLKLSLDNSLEDSSEK